MLPKFNRFFIKYYSERNKAIDLMKALKPDILDLTEVEHYLVVNESDALVANRRVIEGVFAFLSNCTDWSFIAKVEDDHHGFPCMVELPFPVTVTKLDFLSDITVIEIPSARLNLIGDLDPEYTWWSVQRSRYSYTNMCIGLKTELRQSGDMLLNSTEYEIIFKFVK